MDFFSSAKKLTDRLVTAYLVAEVGATTLGELGSTAEGFWSESPTLPLPRSVTLRIRQKGVNRSKGWVGSRMTPVPGPSVNSIVLPTRSKMVLIGGLLPAKAGSLATKSDFFTVMVSVAPGPLPATKLTTWPSDGRTFFSPGSMRVAGRVSEPRPDAPWRISGPRILWRVWSS